jgi:hypothetical protein
MLKDKIDNPDHWNHALYQKRVNRWTIVIEVVLILTYSISSIEVPANIPGPAIAYQLVIAGRWFLVGIAVWFAVSIVIACYMLLWEWMMGK